MFVFFLESSGGAEIFTDEETVASYIVANDVETTDGKWILFICLKQASNRFLVNLS